MGSYGSLGGLKHPGAWGREPVQGKDPASSPGSGTRSPLPYSLVSFPERKT